MIPSGEVAAAFESDVTTHRTPKALRAKSIERLLILQSF
jgi:hypothetical protein